jgi:hypothetical protein
LYELEKYPHTKFFIASWVVEGIAMVLATIFILEAMHAVLAGYEAIQRLGRNLLIVTGLALIAFTLFTANSGADNSIPIEKLTLVTDRSIKIVQIGIIVVFFVFSRYLALSWRHYLFGIVFPYGLYAGLNLAVATFAAQKGDTYGYRLMLIDSIAYICLHLLWLKYLLQPEPKGPSELPPSASADLERWDEALSGMSIAKGR